MKYLGNVDQAKARSFNGVVKMVGEGLACCGRGLPRSRALIRLSIWFIGAFFKGRTLVAGRDARLFDYRYVLFGYLKSLFSRDGLI